jgi:MFS family permease
LFFHLIETGFLRGAYIVEFDDVKTEVRLHRLLWVFAFFQCSHRVGEGFYKKVRRGPVEIAAVYLRQSVALTVMIGLWGLGGFAVNSAQQARLAGLAPPLTPTSVALNTSCIYLGQAIGAALGSALIAWRGTAALAWPVAMIYLLAIAVSIVASKKART